MSDKPKCGHLDCTADAVGYDPNLPRFYCAEHGDSHDVGMRPAFPYTPGPEGPVWELQGMTLRDWFAGQAIVGLLSAYGAHAKQDKHGDLMIHTSAVGAAFDLADLMLAERCRLPSDEH